MSYNVLMRMLNPTHSLSYLMAAVCLCK